MLQLTPPLKLAVWLLPLLGATAIAADLDQPLVNPPIPGVSSVALEWSAVQAIRGKTTYTVLYCNSDDFPELSCENLQTGKSTKKLKVTQDGLDAAVYRFQIEAEDNGGNSALSEWTDEVTVEDGGGDPPGDECNYPGFSDPPGSGGLTDFVPPGWLASGDLVFADEFDGLSTVNWIIDDMTDPLNQTGNPDINEFGAVDPGSMPSGKRWSAWYDDSVQWSNTIGAHSLTTSGTGIHYSTGLGTGDYLQLGGVRELPAIDLTRPGSPPWDTTRLHTAFLKTWTREQVNEGGPYSEAPFGQKWMPPMYLETMVDFSLMNTPGFRLSMWLMPATYVSGALATNQEAYDGDPNNGMELDIFEYEPWRPDCGELLEFSWINSFATRGKAGRNARGNNNFEGFEEGYEIAQGMHKIALLWEDDRIQWVFNDKVVLELTGADKIPDIYQYLIISREMTNGRLDADTVASGGSYSTYLPAEPGLYGWAGGSNIGDYLGSVNSDKTMINYVRIYQPSQ